MNLSRVLFRSLGSRLPLVDGNLDVPGLDEPISIRRDEYGVPHIDANNDSDAWFGLGFCHGQDRAFQLEMLVRTIRGTVSDEMGVDGLPVDRLSRRVGIKHAADSQFSVQDTDIQQMLTAYAEGINAGRQYGHPRRPHEFSILRMGLTPWTASDAIGTLIFASLTISTNWTAELTRYQILVKDGLDALEALEPEAAAWHPVTNPPGAPAGKAASRLFQEARDLLESAGFHNGGSNNWVVSGSKTASGRPILANDIHMSPMLPTQFYLAHIDTPDWSIAGGSFVGTPGFYQGHNGFAAWGVTIGYLDNTDLFVEQIGPDGMSVREGEEFVPCDVRDEHIRVKGADDVIERVLVTGRGPIIGPALDGDPGAISLCATWLAARPYRSLLSAHTWRSIDEAKQALSQHPMVSLNVAYADADGNIGWVLAGEIPQRSGSGALPLPGWDRANHWAADPNPTDERLHALNPDGGFLATANNRPIPESEAAGLGVDWAEGYRVARIGEMLQERDDWDVSGTLLAQMDTESIPWREVRPIVTAIRPVDDDSKAGKEILKNWNGQTSPASTGAALYEVFMAVLARKIAERAAPASWEWALGRSPVSGVPGFPLSVRVNHLIRLMSEKPRGWFDEGWNVAIAHSIGDAIRMLRFGFGNQTRRWNWGAVRPLQVNHPVGRGPLSGVFNRGPFVVGGDSHTVHAAGVSARDPLGPARPIAVARTVIEPGDWDNARFVLLGGQSGNPLSSHYDDQIPVWLQGRGISIAWSPERVAEATRSALHLVPGQGRR